MPSGRSPQAGLTVPRMFVPRTLGIRQPAGRGLHQQADWCGGRWGGRAVAPKPGACPDLSSAPSTCRHLPLHKPHPHLSCTLRCPVGLAPPCAPSLWPELSLPP